MNSLDYVVNKVLSVIRSQKKTGAYDDTGTVKRVDGNIAWVHFDSGVNETPVVKSIDCKKGDKVRVRISNGKAFMVGNETAPPTDDAKAIVAHEVAVSAEKDAEQAEGLAQDAMNKATENAEEMARAVLAINEDIENLQEQIDGNITSWFYNVDPAMNLPPVAVDPLNPDGTGWDTDDKKNNHLGDLYYNTDSGKVWRFVYQNGAYSWVLVEDSDVTRALELATQAKDTADSKRRVFVATPVPPYDVGDLWVQGTSGDIMRCSQAKTSAGSYSASDWVKASKYTDDTVANAAKSVADNTAQYFWYKTGSGTEAGAHVTETAQEDFESTPTGGNILMRSNGIKLRMALVTLAELTSDGMKVYSSNDSTNPVAQFLNTGTILGKTTGIHSVATANGTEYLNGSNPIGRLDYYMLEARPNMRMLASATPDQYGDYDDKAYVWVEADDTSELGAMDDVALVADNTDGTAAFYAEVNSGWDTALYYAEMRAEKNVSVLVHPESVLRVSIDSNNNPRLIYNNNELLKSGSDSFSSVATGSIGTKTISFSGYSTAPKVMVTFTENSTNANFGGCALSVTSVSTTGATIKLYNNSGSSKSPSFSWVAIGI